MIETARFTRMKQPERPLVIGLINNMGISAMAPTKAQFSGLLNAAARECELLCFTMRAPQDGAHGHLPIDALQDFSVDAIIVTGMEVTTSDLRDEWIWQRFTRLYDWCEREAIPVIWSCLAAHAAVLYRDGITRQPLGAKLSGVFDCQHGASPHRLMQDMPVHWSCPHSRYNGLSGQTLAARGYKLVSYGEAVGVDIFMREDNPASFYFQGHPEYHAETLLQEFMRDLRRYIAGETATCPSVPAGYFNAQDEQMFTALRKQALAGHDILSIARERAAHAGFRRRWFDAAARLYSNWLDIVAERAVQSANWPLAVEAAPPTGAALS